MDTTLLIGIWGIEKGGDAAFRISNKDFFMVDEFSTSPYSLEKNKLIIHNSDYYREGIIIGLSKDSLKIKWDFANEPWRYWRFNK